MKVEASETWRISEHRFDMVTRPLIGFAVHRVLEEDVRVAGLELDLGEGLEEAAGVDLLLVDAPVVDHLAVLLGHGDLREGHAVDARRRRG